MELKVGKGSKKTMNAPETKGKGTKTSAKGGARGGSGKGKC